MNHVVKQKMTSTHQEKILVFVPGRNVGRTIEDAMEKLSSLRRPTFQFDIVYIDNVSKDGSADKVEVFKQKQKANYITIIRNPKDVGYGGSNKIAFDYAFKNNYTYMIEFAGDLQNPYEKIPELYTAIRKKNTGAVFGSRALEPSNLAVIPWWKVLGMKLTNKINSWAFDLPITEVHTGFRIFDLRKIQGVNFTNTHTDYRWSLDSVVELLKVRCTFAEIPIRSIYHAKATGPSLKELYIVVSYMILRSLKYKIRGI